VSISCPGPDGFEVTFYGSCWEMVKGVLMEMVYNFFNGQSHIERPSYGIITLIPKIHDVVNVKQFRPICLLNVSFKIVSKLMMDRLTPFADKVIDNCQTTFIKGRYILDGVVILHEVIHEWKRKRIHEVIHERSKVVPDSSTVVAGSV
jgi:hypothetical protein